MMKSSLQKRLAGCHGWLLPQCGMAAHSLLALALSLSLTVSPSMGAEPAAEKLPDGAQLAALEATPTSITLTNKYAYAQLVITGVLDSGERIDVTRMVTIDEPAGRVQLNDHRLVRPVADGATSLTVSLAGKTLSIPVTVTGHEQDYPVSYIRDVGPAMSKMGCNAGLATAPQRQERLQAIAARLRPAVRSSRPDRRPGRPAFQSCRAGPEPDAVKTLGGRAAHGGRVDASRRAVLRVVRAWIAAGVKLDLEAPRVAKIEVLPQGPQIPLPGMKQQVMVVATYTDGAVRDVTAEAFLESSTTEVVEVDKQGLATGRAAVKHRCWPATKGLTPRRPWW